MKKLFAVILLIFFCSVLTAQKLSQVTFSGGSRLSFFSFLTDQGVLIRVSEDGHVIEWGIEEKSDWGNYYAPKLQPFMGRVDYYGAEADSASRGKLKSIGTCFLTYYTQYEMNSKAGKIKNIGSVALDYFTHYDNPAFQGKIMLCGDLVLEYYPSTENEAIRGKLKSVGPVTITYYSSFDDKLIQGKLKTIGHAVYTWHASYSRSGFRGGLKSGRYRQEVSGITYILAL